MVQSGFGAGCQSSLCFLYIFFSVIQQLLPCCDPVSQFGELVPKEGPLLIRHDPKSVLPR